MWRGARISPESQLSDPSTRRFQWTWRRIWRLFTLFTQACSLGSSWQPLAAFSSAEGKDSLPTVLPYFSICSRIFPFAYTNEIEIWPPIVFAGCMGSWGTSTDWTSCGNTWGGTRLRSLISCTIMMKSWSTVRWWTMGWRAIIQGCMVHQRWMLLCQCTLWDASRRNNGGWLEYAGVAMLLISKL